MDTQFRSIAAYAIILSLASFSGLSLSSRTAVAQFVAPPTTVVPYDAPPQTLIPRAGSIGRALTPPTYYRSAPQAVPTTVYRPVTAYHPVTGQPYTRWDAASTQDVETQRVATPLPGYGAPFTAYRPVAPVTAMPSYYAPTRPMNVQGWVDPNSGNVASAPVAGYSSFRPIYNPGPGTTSVAPAYAVGRPVMGAPVVSYRGAWPMAAARPAPIAVQYAPAPGNAPPAFYAPPVYRGTTAAPSYQGATPSYIAPAYSAPAGTYTAPATYSAPASSDPYYSPRTVAPAYSDPNYSNPSYSDPGYAPRGVPADEQPNLRSSSLTSPRGSSVTPTTSGTSSPSTASTRPLVPAQESAPSTSKPEVNWPKFLPNTTRQPAPASSTVGGNVGRTETLREYSSEEPPTESPFSTSGRRTITPEKEPKKDTKETESDYDPDSRPLRDPHSRIPDLKDHRAPPLLEGRSAGVTAPIRRLTLTPSDNVTGHTANPAAR